MYEKSFPPYHGGYPGDISGSNQKNTPIETPLSRDVEHIIAHEVIPMTISGNPRSAVEVIIANVLDHNGYIADFTEEFYQQLDFYPDGSSENGFTEELIVDLVGLEKNLFDNLRILINLQRYESALNLTYSQQVIRISELFKNKHAGVLLDEDYFEHDEEPELDIPKDDELSKFIDEEEVDNAMRIVTDNYDLDELRTLLNAKDRTLDQLYVDDDYGPVQIPVIEEFRNALALYINVNDFHAGRYDQN